MCFDFTDSYFFIFLNDEIVQFIFSGVVVSKNDEFVWASITIGKLGFEICLTKLCLKTNGAAVNTGSSPCGCGNTICDGTTGMVCFASQNRCAVGSTCLNNNGVSINANDCTCGSSACDASTGFYCFASQNRCAVGPPCSNNIGVSVNANDCTCGSSDCDASTGFYCFASQNRCAVGPPCSNNIGVSVNAKDCSCGSSDCDGTTGRFCLASGSICAATKIADRFQVTKGSCTTSGSCFQSPNYPGNYGLRNDCTIKVLNVFGSEKLFSERFYTQGDGDKLTIGGTEYYTMITHPYTYIIPIGVVVSVNDEISWVSDAGYTMNTESPYGFKICLAVECSQKNGKIENTGAPTCNCGTTVCDETAGMYCFANGNKCSPNAIQVCTTTDGSEANLNDCTCGTSECTAATGRKCVASLNECSPSQCSETDGTRTNSNAESCVCGDGSDTRKLVRNKGKGAVCSTATGFFCTASINTCSLYAPCEASKWTFSQTCTSDLGCEPLAGGWNELTASCTLTAKIQIGSGQTLKIRKHPSMTTELVVDRSGKGILGGLVGSEASFFEVDSDGALFVEGVTLTGGYYTGGGGVVRV